MTKKTEIKKVRCNICSAGCPIDAYVQDGKLLSVEGSRDWPGQQGGLCSKGAASRQYVYNKDRILYPMKRVGERGSGEFERISWEEAYAMIISLVVPRFFFARIASTTAIGFSFSIISPFGSIINAGLPVCMICFASFISFAR